MEGRLRNRPSEPLTTPTAPSREEGLRTENASEAKKKDEVSVQNSTQPASRRTAVRSRAAAITP
ncbi:hypothetical protein HFP72_23465 [Nocardiopsis sp. ARC36]